MQTVPFNDLSRIHDQFIDDSLNNFKKVIKNSSFVLNEYINQFEIDFAKFTHQKYTISCANGTDAIELILRALGIGFGDEVLLPSNSFVATSIAVSRCGATPVFVDNDEFYLIDLSDLKKNISRKTKAIIAVNLYGQMADLKSLSKIAKENGVFLIEDAAQSHGAFDRYNKFVGDYSIAAAYSFYPGKNLGAWGDGGAITTNNKKLADKMKALRVYGSEKKYYHKYLGFNSRLQPFQGYVLSQKLKYLNEWNQERNEIANIYSERLSSYKNIVTPKVFNKNKHVWHLYVVRVKNRNTIIEIGKKNGVEFSIHYPVPIHKQKAYKNHFQSKKLIKNSENYSKNLLSLPIFPKMKKTEVELVLKTLLNIAK